MLVTMLLLPVGLAYRTPCERVPVPSTQPIGRWSPDTTPVQRPEMPVIGSRAKPLPANRSAEAERAALPKYFAKHDVTAPIAIVDSLPALYRDYGDHAPPNPPGIALPKLIVIDGAGVVRSVMTGWNKEPTERALFATLEKLMPPRK